MPATPAPTQSVAKLTDAEKIAHLLNRAAFGPWYGDVDRIRRIGIEQYVEEQLHPERINNSEAEALVAAVNTAAQLPSGIVRSPRAFLQQLQGQKLIRAVYSRRQLQEVMVDFWFNHFNVFWGKQSVQNLTGRYEQEAIRPHALGKFKDLLLATTKHPAMLMYLDNAVSAAEGINENYARELMELHTMGVDGGYTQQDVQEVARCFTGWTVDDVDKPTTFAFREDIHDRGEKTVLGQTIQSAGYGEGESVLSILAHHPSTARFIARKLVRWFVAYDPPQTLADRVTEVFTQTDGDIREMLWTILSSDEFWSPRVFRAKIKSPFELVVSIVRATSADMNAEKPDVRFSRMGFFAIMNKGRFELSQIVAAVSAGLSFGTTNLLEQIEQMGQFLYQYEEPTGYPDRGDFWMSGWAVLVRVRFAAALAAGEIAGVSVGKDVFSKLSERVSGDSASKTALDILSGVSDGTPNSAGGAARVSLEEVSAAEALTKAFALALGSPEFQRK